MHDGQNLFDPQTSFIKGNYWRMGETADALIASGEVEPLVIVGIYNAGAKRIDEYTPLEDRRLGGGNADAYGQMLVEELRPFVAHRYRTLAGPENCGMGGSSLGGLVTLYLGMRYPDVYRKACRVIAVSVVARSRDSEVCGADSTEDWAAHLARHRYQRRTARYAGRARAEADVGQERLAAGQGPRVSRDPGRHNTANTHGQSVWGLC